MGTTPRLGIPYIDPSDLMANYPTQDKAQAEFLENLLLLSNPALPAINEGYAAADMTIVATAQTETPTLVRASITNPHPTKRMLAHNIFGSRLVLGGSAGICYMNVTTLTGSPAQAVGQHYIVMNTAQIEEMMFGSQHLWIPATQSITIVLNAWKSVAGSTMTARVARNSLIPIRYE